MREAGGRGERGVTVGYLPTYIHTYRSSVRRGSEGRRATGFRLIATWGRTYIIRKEQGGANVGVVVVGCLRDKGRRQETKGART